MSEPNDSTTADVMDLLIAEGRITTLQIEQDDDGNIVSVDKTNLGEHFESLNSPDTPMSPEAQLHRGPPSLTFASLTAADKFKIAQSFARGVKAADIKTTKMFKSAFVGKAAVDWMEVKVPGIVGVEGKNSCSRPVAVEIGQWLLTEGHIWVCEGQKVKAEFQDDSPTYRHLAGVLLLDEPIPQEVAVFLLQKMKAQDTGVPLKEEKVLMKKLKGVFAEFDLEQWIFKAVEGIPEKELPKVTKALLKKGLVEKVALSSFLQFPSK